MSPEERLVGAESRARPPLVWTPILYDIAHTLESCEDPEARVARVMTLVGHFVPYDRCALLDATPILRDSVLVTPTASGEQAALAARLFGLLRLVSDPTANRERRVDPAMRAGGAHLAVPVLSLGETVGILLVESGRARYEEAHLGLLSIVAAQLGAYLTVLRAERSIRRSEEERAALLAERERDVELLHMFVAMLGHDLRNPLNAVKMTAEWLRAEGRAVHDPERLRRMAGRICSSTNRMDRMVHQLLDLTRVRLAGGMPIDRRPTDLVEVCQRTIEELQAVHPEAPLRLEAEGHAVGHWDPDRLLQATSNIIGNAIQHSCDGVEPVVRIGANEDTVEMSVHNVGVIPRSLLPVLFHPFRGLQDKSRPKGLGLGLFITKQIVDAHGGTLQVRSSEAEGTTVTMRLPRGFQATDVGERSPR